jgi:hypothetical protein
LLRSANLCRNEGMHVLARSALRMAEHIKRRGANDHAFALSEATDDLISVLQESFTLSRTLPHASASMTMTATTTAGSGSGRRQYAESGGMRLVGLACEPVVTSSGFAGVVTYLADDRGNTFHLSEVMPGGASQVWAKYATAVRVGETTITHENLSRSGLVISGATVAPDGRLGAGQGVRAAPISAASNPLEELERSASNSGDIRKVIVRALTESEHPSVFAVHGVIVGAEHNALRCVIGRDTENETNNEIAVRIVPAGVHPDLPGLSNLNLLSRCVGMKLLMVCSAVADDEPTLRVLSWAPLNAHDVAFPESWRGRCNIGIDRLEPSMIRYAASEFALMPQVANRPYSDARRVIERVGVAGTVALHNAQTKDLDRTVVVLHKCGFAHGARHFTELRNLTTTDEREPDGRLRPAPTDRSAQAWLACALWERELRRSLALDAWAQE